MRYFTLITAILLAFSLFAGETPFKRQDSDHLKDIFNAWDSQKGEYLYESINAIVMNTDYPNRQSNISQTSFEMLQSMDSKRVDRILKVASSELENERNSASNQNNDYYWESWISYVNSARCNDMNRGQGNGDPHMTTFDGEKYDFQNAGDYLLSSSYDNSFVIQTQTYRPSKSSKISQIGGVAMNINGDVVEFSGNGSNGRDGSFIINGEPTQIKQTQLLPNGGVIEYNSRKSYRHTVKWPTGEQANIRVRGNGQNKMIDLSVRVPSCNENQYVGLLGNNDGNKGNDIVVSDDNAVVRTPSTPPTDFEDVFGPNRRQPEVKEKHTRRSQFIAYDFSDQFMLNADNTMFIEPMVDIPDEVRYPQEHLSLAELSDEQIEEGLKKAREAGVEEDDLFAAVYDYGHVGLDPVSYDDEYEEPTEKKEETTIPPIENPNRNNGNNANTNTKSNDRVIIINNRGSTYRNPYRNRKVYGSPYGGYRQPTPTYPSGSYGTTKPSTRGTITTSPRRPTSTSGVSGDGGRRPSGGGGTTTRTPSSRR